MRASGVFNKNGLPKYTTIGDKQLQEKERGHFKQRSARQAKTLCKLFLNLINLTEIYSALEQS